MAREKPRECREAGTRSIKTVSQHHDADHQQWYAGNRTPHAALPFVDFSIPFIPVGRLNLLTLNLLFDYSMDHNCIPNTVSRYMQSLLPFDDDSPIEGLKQPFEQWLSDQIAQGTLRQPSSIQVYRDMWGGFTNWALSQTPPVTLTNITTSDLQAFQTARFGMKSSDLSLSPRHALRLLRLVDRVVKHQAAQTGEPANNAAAEWIAAQPEIRYAEASQSDPLPDFLSISETRHLITFLSAARPRPGASGSARENPVGLTWQQVRNRAAVALQLGGGLTPADVRALTLRSPIAQGGRIKDRPWKIAVPNHGNWPARETPIAPWAGELLHHWLKVRQDAAIAGDFLFPSTRTGKQWSRDSHYMCANKVLEEAGIDSTEGGSFRLRHTFALRQLRRGTSSEQVALWLGVEPDSMNQYGRLMEAMPDSI